MCFMSPPRWIFVCCCHSAHISESRICIKKMMQNWCVGTVCSGLNFFPAQAPSYPMMDAQHCYQRTWPVELSLCLYLPGNGLRCHPCTSCHHLGPTSPVYPIAHPVYHSSSAFHCGYTVSGRFTSNASQLGAWISPEMILFPSKNHS